MNERGRVAAVVLAAGRGTRFGSTKQLADVDGRPLIRVTVESVLVSDVDDVVVVLGHDAERVRGALAGLPIRTVDNEGWAEGMSTSLATGIASLEDDDGCAIVVLGDQPVAAGVVERLIERWRDGERDIVAPEYAGVRGNPVLFDGVLFPLLTTLIGDRGARDLLDACPDRIARVAFDYATPPDVDRPEDVDRLRAGPRAGSGEPGQSDRPGPL